MLIERDFLGAWDLVGKDGKPREFVVEIAKVEGRKVYSQQAGKDRGKCVIEFKGSSKPLIAGATLCQTIEGMYGSDVTQWVGRLITLYPTTTAVGRKKDVPCIRIRPNPPERRPEPIKGQPVDPAMRAKQDEAFGRDRERQPGEEG